MVTITSPQDVQQLHPDETPVGTVGPFQLSLVQEDLEQVVVIRGYRSDALPVVLRRLGLAVEERAGACYLRRTPELHQVLVDLHELICALQYLRPHFGQLVLLDELSEEVPA